MREQARCLHLNRGCASNTYGLPRITASNMHGTASNLRYHVTACAYQVRCILPDKPVGIPEWYTRGVLLNRAPRHAHDLRIYTASLHRHIPWHCSMPVPQLPVAPHATLPPEQQSSPQVAAQSAACGARLPPSSRMLPQQHWPPHEGNLGAACLQRWVRPGAPHAAAPPARQSSRPSAAAAAPACASLPPGSAATGPAPA